MLDASCLLKIGQKVGQYELSRRAEDGKAQVTRVHTSILTGHQYIDETLGPTKFRQVRETFRMPKSTMEKLCTWLEKRNLLQSSRIIGIEEKLAIFMRIVGQNSSNHNTQDRFQHSGDTISR